MHKPGVNHVKFGVDEIFVADQCHARPGCGVMLGNWGLYSSRPLPQRTVSSSNRGDSLWSHNSMGAVTGGGAGDTCGQPVNLVI